MNHVSSELLLSFQRQFARSGFIRVPLIERDNNSLNNESRVFTEIKMPIDSYETTGSPPCRLVRLAAAAVGVELNLKQISLENLEHITPEYLKVHR